MNPDIVGNLGEAVPTVPGKATADTVWIGDWSFDSGGGCTSAGWIQYDNRILNGGINPAGLEVDGHTVWTEVSTFNGEGLIVGKIGRAHV